MDKADTLFTNAQLIDPEHNTQFYGAISVSKGKIAAIITEPNSHKNPAIEHCQHIIDCKGCFVAPGLIDVGVKIGEPGERDKESFGSASAAAAAGGVTTMVTRADTVPAIDTPEVLEFAIRRAAATAEVRVVPMAALTKGRKGRLVVEIGFLQDAGAVAFSDGDRAIKDTRTFMRCLHYAQSLDALVLGHPQDAYLSRDTVMTAGYLAVLKGLSAVPKEAELINVQRDIAIVDITGTRYHFDQITTEKALSAVHAAKERGLPITAGVSIHHMLFNEHDIGDYKTFFKVKPPLRSKTDQAAVIRAVASGVIDIVCSMHTPQSEELKRLPFSEAASGAIGLETLLSAALSLYHKNQITLPILFRALAFNPARLLGLPSGRLTVGAPADLVLFDTHSRFRVNRFALKSKSKNTPLHDHQLKGCVQSTWVAGKCVYSKQG